MTLAAMTFPEIVETLTQPLLAAVPIALMCSVLSVLVVVKRLGFIGQGISHSAFGGIGLATMGAALGLVVPGGVAEFTIVLVFCGLTALGMAFTGRKREVSIDASIGLFLVASMAVGGLLVHAAQQVATSHGRTPDVRSWESILFGSIIVTGNADIVLAWAAAAVVFVAAGWCHRGILFWAFDEESARAFGIPAAAIKALVMILLTLAVVTSMKLAGVVLATALLVLPGATALRVTDRLWPCIIAACAIGVGGIVAGLFASIVLDWQPGPCIVLVLTACFAVATGATRLSAGRTPRPVPSPS